MKSLKLISKIIMAGVFLLFMSTSLFAQSQTNTSNQVLSMGIPEVALINAVDSSANTAAVNLQLTTNIAGTSISGGTGTSFAQVSSIVSSSSTRTIQANYDQIPAGTVLAVTGAIPSNGDGGGSFGSSSGSVTLSTTAQDIFTGIGSCYTGVSPGDGYKLSWNWSAGTPSVYQNIFATSGSSTTVTLTITAAK